MSLRLKSKKILRLVSLISACLMAVVFIALSVKGTVYNGLDYKALDLFYRNVIDRGGGPAPSVSPKINYVTITDDTYSYLGQNYLDRFFLEKVNHALSELDIQAAAYDIIFSRPTNPAADTAFAASIDELGSVYLPIGLNTGERFEPFAWGKGEAYERFRKQLKLPSMKGENEPFYGSWALMQFNVFATAAFNSGHISAHTDSDGVFRHMLMVIKVDDQFFPCLALSMFLDYAGVAFEDIFINWGEYILVPATEQSFLDEEVRIPIDKNGRTYIPFWQTWKNEFKELPAHMLIETMKDQNLSGNLLEIFEGSFVFIGDIAMGISDLGNTPLEKDVPLITLHTAMLNAMLTNQFYTKWSHRSVILVILFLCLILWISALPKSSGCLYAVTMSVFLGLAAITWFQFVNFRLFPLSTVGASCLFFAAGLIVSIEVVTAKERTFIRNIFARYVPEKVVNHLLIHPELLRLGGQIKEISLMMSDLRGFTALAASRPPEEIIKMLNRYFDKMVTIIQDHDGIIDEFIGDGILAFFGAPEPIADHRGKAVACALSMQAAMEDINLRNQSEGFPEIEMGIAVNTGKVVLGNIGSKKRTKYGAVGSEVNFTGRAESYTVGGQVLITQSTYEKLANSLHIKNVMAVEMKGMPEKVNLYDVVGIKAPYHILLSQKEEIYFELENEIQIVIFKLDAKIVDKKETPSFITHLSEKNAKIKISKPLGDFENVRLNFPQAQSYETDEGSIARQAEAYAKVMSLQKLENGYQAILKFTSVSAAAAVIFQTERKRVKAD